MSNYNEHRNNKILDNRTNCISEIHTPNLDELTIGTFPSLKSRERVVLRCIIWTIDDIVTITIVSNKKQPLVLLFSNPPSHQLIIYLHFNLVNKPSFKGLMPCYSFSCTYLSVHAFCALLAKKRSVLR